MTHKSKLIFYDRPNLCYFYSTMAHGHKEETYREFSSDRMNSLQDARLRWR